MLKHNWLLRRNTRVYGYLCSQEVCTVDIIKPRPVTLQNMLKTENISMAANEIIVCNGIVLVAVLPICGLVVYMVIIPKPDLAPAG